MLEDLFNYLRQLKVYAFGKGILTLAVMGAAAACAAFGISFWLPAALVGIGGTVLTAASRLYQQSLYEQEMVDIYRASLAEQFHLAPEDVSRTTLHEAAQSNHVIAQALERQRHKTILTISTAALAGAVSMVALGAFDAAGLMHGLAERTLTGMLEPLAGLVGIGTVASATSLLLHNGLDAAIGHSTGISRASANDLIFAMEHRIARGRPVCREEVYGVLVASNRALHAAIATQFGKTYAAMNPAEQSHVLHQHQVAATMDALALEISNRRVWPSHLAFIAERYTPGKTNNAAAPVAAAEAEEKSQGRGFVERLGLAPRAQEAGHVARLAATEPTAGLSAAR